MSDMNHNTGNNDIGTTQRCLRRAGRRPPRILLGITGSVAAVKGPEIAVRLARDGKCDVRVLLTRGGENFWFKAKEYDPTNWDELAKRSISAISVVNEESVNEQKDYEEVRDGLQNVEGCRRHFSASCEEHENAVVNDGELSRSTDNGEEGKIWVHMAKDEWDGWNRLGDPVLHIELRDWADIALIAPLSAHTLAKLATGMCDDALSCCLRAWDFGYHATRPGKPLILAPAMNSAMWDHPLTKSQIRTIRAFWNPKRGPNRIHVVEPQVKTLACGEIGAGALANVRDILQVVEKCLEDS